jgi:hypothetical protein
MISTGVCWNNFAWPKNKIILTLLLLANITCYAQKKDSLAIYKKLKKFAAKHHLTQMMYEAVFVEPKPMEYPAKPASKEEKIVNPYLKYSNRVIRKINITVLDPFGYSVTDTTRKKINTSEKLGNHWHVTTRRWVIANKLLFKKNDALDALSLSETERLIRQSVYVNDARIFISETNSKDSVDVNVIVQDKWSVTIPAMVTDVSANARLRDQNLFGLGQQFEQYVGYRRPNLLDYNGYYTISNIRKTYISTTLSYQADKDGTQEGLSFDRPFYSPLAKWAGGISAGHSQHFYYYKDTIDGLDKHLNVVNYNYDVWGGKSIKLNNKKKLFNQSNNIILAGRHYATVYAERSLPESNIIKFYPNAQTYIGNVGYAIQEYYKDKYIYRFGANEDVPEGLILLYVYGAEKKELIKMRYYSGIEIARARHYNFGYLSATFSYSIFFNKYISNDITTNYKLYYFSDLFKIGKWYARQFVNYNLLYGINKPSAEKITLTSDELYGFNSGSLNGNTKMVLNLETVAYAPYNLIGFHFAPVLLTGFGMIDNSHNNVFQSNLYQAYSLGLMVRNENLLSSTFQVSFGLYPFLPNGQNNVFKYNPVTSFTLRVTTFSVSKPSFVTY